MPIEKRDATKKRSGHYNAAAQKAYYSANAEKIKAYLKRWRLENREKLNIQARALYRKHHAERREIALQKKFGMSRATYLQMLQAQNGVCAICKGPQIAGREMAVDHDHRSGAVRELLCSRCNQAIGLLRDSPSLCAAAGAYLEKHGCR